MNIAVAALFKTVHYIYSICRKYGEKQKSYLSWNTNSFNVSNNYNQNTNIIVHSPITTDERSQTLSWLSPLKSWERHHGVAANRIAGVGGWVLKTSEFQAWRSRKGNDSVDAVLFCYGAPGVGKTFICSLAIDRLCDESAGCSIGVACLYCDYRCQGDQMPTNMIGSLLKQFVAGLPEVPGVIKEAFQTAKGQLGGRAPQLHKIIDLFPKVLALYEQAFIFIDALDELHIELRVEFIRALGQIARESPNTQIFVTGRLHVQAELDRHLTKSLSTISINPKDEDLRAYLKMRLHTDPDPDAMDDDLKHEILTHLPRQFSRIFLLVALQTDAILGETTIHNRRETLYRVANRLNDVYRTTLERIIQQPGNKQKLGIAVLMFVSLVGRAVHVDELCDAIGLYEGSHDLNTGIKNAPSIETLLGSCLGLVTFDRETSTVRLVHTTSVIPCLTPTLLEQ
ncbi:hypothetical protein L873DRAFT_1697016 [Choiromyces venosus 120613-1]|uniref:Nephrocystin 3-like N-terminal domain-containing protein n=1 Tax=Choiromyces venosus 120613-1 TaxID=1336337 RepID=A0A3N4JG84_9PEZI|nr:hypothetical protein L873DRAFT_1697016 [Choiromyces venosus 120613-1]